MIEIPESICLANQLNETLKGKTVVDAISMKNPHKFAFTFGDPKEYPKMLVGKTFTLAESHGSWVVIDFEGIEFMVSEGTRLLFTSEAAKLPKKHQMFIEFDDGSYLCASIQMYGGLVCAEKGDYDNEYYLISLDKPSVMDDAFDEKYFRGMISNETLKKSIKAFLATEQRIPGLGNGVLQDILFNAGINPKTKVKDISEGQMSGLFKTIKNTISEMIEAGGRDTEKNLFGNPGGYETKMSKNTAGKPCPVFGTAIEKASYMGGSVYFCKKCQPLPK